MSTYEAAHLLLVAVAVAVAAVGGVYALKSLLLLNRNQEVLRIQRRIWLPILSVGGVLALDSVVHMAADLAPSTTSFDTLEITDHLLLVASLTLLSLGIFRYWSTQREYEAEKSGGRRQGTETA